MIQFFAPDIENEPVLPEGESSHCSRVLRMKEGDEIIVTDGKGSRFLCVIDKSHPKHTSVTIKGKEKLPPERNYHLTIAIAPTKNPDRMEWFVEKAVEIGVDKIVLLKCERSERKFQKEERLQKVMVSAMKQSLSVNLPELVGLTEFEKFIKTLSQGSQKYFGYCSDFFPRKSLVKECKAGGEIIVLIGPEGDFTPGEVEVALKAGFIPVSFGEKRLRTETAGVFATSAVNIINQQSE